MTERKLRGVNTEINDISESLNKLAGRAKELIIDIIQRAEKSGSFPTLIFVDNPDGLRRKRAETRVLKAVHLGFDWIDGRKFAVVLREDGSIMSTQFGYVYNTVEAKYGRYNTASKVGETRYYSQGRELSGIRFLQWFSTAAEKFQGDEQGA